MASFTDIDGSNVMAGSPDLLGCAETELRSLLGEYHHQTALHVLANLEPGKCPNPAVAEAVRRRARVATALVAEAVAILIGDVRHHVATSVSDIAAARATLRELESADEADPGVASRRRLARAVLRLTGEVDAG